ncbi:MAG: hypothetical protein WKG00_22025 [Polyangiaceae bacterium]
MSEAPSTPPAHAADPAPVAAGEGSRRAAGAAAPLARAADPVPVPIEH